MSCAGIIVGGINIMMVYCLRHLPQLINSPTTSSLQISERRHRDPVSSCTYTGNVKEIDGRFAPKFGVAQTAPVSDNTEKCGSFTKNLAFFVFFFFFDRPLNKLSVGVLIFRVGEKKKIHRHIFDYATPEAQF